MKRYMITAILAALVGVAGAQDKPKLDHGYSTGNYKHANKAAVARQQEQTSATLQRDGSVRETLGLQSTGNYKAQRPYSTLGKLNTPAPPVTGYATTDRSQSPRNYKTGVPMTSSAEAQQAKRTKDSLRTTNADE
ncbi:MULTISPECIES: hypothetical protein [unclassified Siphonobacter]|uniref:hypothetical protein n=1 Tax=unclassified Siphonobacter TaxID=2635712 RepID=UPI0012FF0920|nr:MULTISPECIES: hypothetical protein [unclassified Siphonobacter]MDQ1086202.1 hypothetical protein [Siphonobacter sp. SORGH_AS_1065]